MVRRWRGAARWSLADPEETLEVPPAHTFILVAVQQLDHLLQLRSLRASMVVSHDATGRFFVGSDKLVEATTPTNDTAGQMGRRPTVGGYHFIA